MGEYEKCQCGANCDHYEMAEDQPCWGEVGPHGLSSDDDFAHLCEGHADVYYGGQYTPEPKVKP